MKSIHHRLKNSVKGSVTGSNFPPFALSVVIFSGVAAWIIANQKDPLRASRHGGPGHWGNALLTTLPVFPAFPPVAYLVWSMTIVSNIHSIQNPLLGSQKSSVDENPLVSNKFYTFMKADFLLPPRGKNPLFRDIDWSALKPQF